MPSNPIIAVLSGGVSSEREVSLGSGKASAIALTRNFPTRLFVVDGMTLPAGLDPACHVVFSTLHGTFGEDGGMQRLLEKAGVQYAGCDSAASELCFNKALTKEKAFAAGVRVCQGMRITGEAHPTASELVAELGDKLIVKPNCNGSSVGLHVISSQAQLEGVLAGLEAGEWLIERRIAGRELTVGVLNGKAMGVVEIVPKSGLFDYASKYTKGLTRYLAPAPIPETVAAAARAASEAAFSACSCRDYARMDFMLSEDNELFFLEINTLPGMKDTSLLPMSAHCVGLDYTALARELVSPAIARFNSSSGN
ncbi:MAG: D-alanine--D-alanine ligase [Opitutaceae bacterium]|jgi:D-alanine-D-alanine ligase